MNEIREQINISDIISDYVPLTQKGQNQWGLCPFHDDNNPSMSVSTTKQIYKCFVCGAGGNVFTFVRDYENISFVEAVVKVAATIGIDLSDSLTQNVSTIPESTKKQLDIMDQASKFYSYQLKTTKDSLVRDFLIKRRIDEDLINTFEIGISSNQNQLSQFLLSKGHQPEDLVELNLVRRNETNFSDVFYDRLLFPISDTQGRVVGFSGRAIHPENDIKYVNTSVTPIYTKGELLYNYHRISNRELKKDPLVICEGVMDVLAFHRAGHQRVIASLGTALTDVQVSLIKRVNSPVILAYDKDSAGISATYQIGKALSDRGVKLSVYNNTTSLDPDEYQKEKGSIALLETLKSSKHWLEFVIEYASSLYSLHSYQSKREVVSFVLQHLVSAESFDQTYFINQLADITGFNNIELHHQLSNIDKKQVQLSKPKRRISQPKVHLLRSENEILSLIINSKQAAYYFRDELGFLINSEANQLALMILEAYSQKDEVNVADLLNKQLSPVQSKILMDITSEEEVPFENIKGMLEDDMRHIQMAAIDQQIHSLQVAARNELDNNKKIEIGQEIARLVLERNKTGNEDKKHEEV